MRKTVLYGALAFCSFMLSSCLGDPATSLTLVNQAGVVGLKPLKVIYVKGGDVISSEDFQKEPIDEGDCILFDYAIDPSISANADGAVAYKTATIYANTITQVDQWPLFNTLGDTVTPVKKELTLSLVQSRYAYIRGQLFLFTEMGNHKPAQQDSFSLSYNPGQLLGTDKTYDFYLRMIQSKTDADSVVGKSMIIPCAFDIQEFIKNAKITQKDNKDVVSFRINYVTSFDKDTTTVTWKGSEVFTVDLPGTGK